MLSLLVPRASLATFTSLLVAGAVTLVGFWTSHMNVAMLRDHQRGACDRRRARGRSDTPPPAL